MSTHSHFTKKVAYKLTIILCLRLQQQADFLAGFRLGTQRETHTPSLILKPNVMIFNEGVIPRVLEGEATTDTVYSLRRNQATFCAIHATGCRDHIVKRAQRIRGQPSRTINGHSKDVCAQ
jgi:hypothetical protein